MDFLFGYGFICRLRVADFGESHDLRPELSIDLIGSSDCLKNACLLVLLNKSLKFEKQGAHTPPLVLGENPKRNAVKSFWIVQNWQCLIELSLIRCSGRKGV